jgi:putative addiction module component (TIGR02574 family)
VKKASGNSVEKCCYVPDYALDVPDYALDLSARLFRMKAHVDQILDEALGLPPDERSALTVALLDSLEGSDDTSITDAWRQEIKARQAALRAGTLKAVSWAEAKARLSAL